MRSHIEDLMGAQATVSRMPVGSGDGYGYGGGIVLTIGDRSLFIGESNFSKEFAQEIADRWNAKNAPSDTKGE